MDRNNSIYIVSASDRFNFGDLLFNYIVAYYLNNEIKVKYNLIFVSLLGNDLTKLEGHKTLGLKKVYRKIKDGDIIIFAGGGLLGHKWSAMFVQSCNIHFVEHLHRLLPRNLFEYFIRIIVFNSKMIYPFTISSSDINKNIKVIYNSVGGGALSGMHEELSLVRSILNKSNYLSVRDLEIQNLLSIDNAMLSPDSAILLSEIYTKNELYNNSRKEIRNYLDSNYVVLHFNKSISGRYSTEINNLIHWIKFNTNLDIIIIPVNYIKNSDLIGQKPFSNNNDCKLISNKLKLFEICSIIAHSQLLIGTSLHSNIIACSYGVPHLGMTREVSKVNMFFSTWYKKNSIFNSYEIEMLPERILEAIQNDQEVHQVSSFIKDKAKENFNRINTTIIN